MPCRHLCVPVRLQYMVPHWRPATTGWFHGIDVLDHHGSAIKSAYLPQNLLNRRLGVIEQKR